MIIHPAKRIVGKLEMPGDKSISHRAAMIAALANGTSLIRNFSTSEDCAATLRCLEQLGVSIARKSDGLVIKGVGARGLRAPKEPLDCGNSGTTMRLLAGVLAGQDFETTLTGDESLRSRPMQRIIEPLGMMGAEIHSNDGRPPLTIRGRNPLRPIDYELLVSSAQVKSAILLAGLNARGQTKVTEQTPTRDHTERMLRWFGVTVEEGDAFKEGQTFAAVTGPASLTAREVLVPGDISSAAYFIAAAALLEGSLLETANVGLNPSRVAFLSVVKLSGLTVNFQDMREQCNEPVGIVRVEGPLTTKESTDTPLMINGERIAGLIDELPLLAVIGSQLVGGIEIRDARELRVKESDRIAATVAGLRAMNAEVEEFEDGLRVAGRTRLRGARIDSRGDHRIAMSFAVAGLLAEGETEIEDAECVSVSFPEFFELLESVVE
ncbi:MAG TPA: 3-phosphoshikimate 1-carboxyvinyltransferase [Pyrinomonadaceae bacterium]|nr:3-phosphoshikimate 1-carboxyvinyltransferase [Pyrinomonadaceae bacterium]